MSGGVILGIFAGWCGGWIVGWIAACRHDDRTIEMYRNLYGQALRDGDRLQTQIDAFMKREPRE